VSDPFKEFAASGPFDALRLLRTGAWEHGGGGEEVTRGHGLVRGRWGAWARGRELTRGHGDAEMVVLQSSEL